MLRAARELLAVRSPLDAELMVSELLGTWWGQQPGRRGMRETRRRRADIEELVGEGLVAYAAEQGSPAALALLSGIACLGTPRQCAQAEQAALEQMERGVARPAWADHVGAVEAAECYVNSDPYGDRDEVVCVFSYAGQEQHALVVVVDYNTGGMARDGWVTSQVGKLLEYCRDGSEPGRRPAGGDGRPDSRPSRTSAPGSVFTQVDPPQARRLLATALAATENAADPAVSSSFPSYHAFIRARVRTLPPALPKGSTGLPAGPAGAMSALLKRQPWRKDRRAMLVAEFLASDAAEDLSDMEAASRCADHIVEYGCERDFGRPLRMSPAKVEAFLLDWLPRKVMLSRSEQDAMPHVLLAWVRWATAREGLSSDGIAATLDAVFDAMRAFPNVYRDPSSFGLEPALVARLLPDGDLEALARRAFAFPLLRGTYHGVDLATLDPSRPDHRRSLLAADHEDQFGPPVSDQHLERHVALADRLWRDDPPELWDAAQRLLDLGEDRHSVLHALMSAIRQAGDDENDIAAALADLIPEEPR
ncbi:MAG TPA: hypothetical protein VHU92_15560 [Streptosporangiaceae bacterium]|jgi:hypothetical protein|nr:hypothetical protein [Streptosporangiaceae bacterium]